MKTIDKIMIIFTNLLLLVVAIWAVTVPVTSSKAFYLYEFEKNNTVEASGYTQAELDNITDVIIRFLMDKNDDMQVVINNIPVFSNQAIYHMQDVKDLYVAGKTVAILCLVLLILSILYIVFYYKRLKNILFQYSVITIAIILFVCLAFAIYAFLDFDSAFTFFHRIIFPDEQKFNDAFFGYVSNYSELPGVSNLMLTTILDERLFMDAGIIIGCFVVFVEVLWFTLLSILKRKIPNLNDMISLK